MGDEINFWTPVKGGHKLRGYVDAYFYLGGSIAIVVPGHERDDSEGVMITKERPTPAHIGLKIITYSTVVIPALLLAVKAALRKGSKFHVCKRVLPNGIEEAGV